MMCRVLGLFLVLLFAAGVRAEEKIKVEEIVVSASRLEEPLEDTVSAVVIVKGEALRETNVEFVPEALRQMPSLNIIQNGGEGTVASAHLRGGDSRHTLVMMDGVKLNSPTAGGFDFSSLGVDDIEKIEIIKGPQSTVYGSEAMAGVINIITKKGEGKTKINTSLEAGSSGTYKPAVTISGGGKLNYRVAASYFKTDGISAAKAGSEKDGFRNASASWKLGLETSKNSEVELSGRCAYGRTELDGFDFMTGAAADDPNFIQRENTFATTLRGRLFISDKWQQTLSASLLRDALRFSDPDTVFNNASIINKINTIDWQHNIYPSEFLTLTAGAEYRDEEGENEGVFEGSMDNKALYLLGKFNTLNEALILNAGLRYDDHEATGAKTTYRAGALYKIKGADMSIRASYGTGFRAPSLNDLFYPFYGNPALKPEESTSFEIGLSKGLLNDKAKVSLAYFRQDYDNLIQTDPVNFIAANIAEAEVKGTEADASVKLTDALNLNAAYTYLDAEDKSSGKRLPWRPRHKAGIGAGYSAGAVSVRADYTYVGGRFDSLVRRELSSYNIVNLSGTYKIKNNLGLFARIENLLDAEYEEAGGYGTKGTSVYAGLKADF